MSESILKALMRLFAIISNFDKGEESMSGREVVRAYLKQQLSLEQLEEYLTLFDEYVTVHHSKKGKKRLSANSVKVLAICEQINEELRQEQKVLVMLQILEFINYDGKVSEEELDFVETVASVFNISPEEYKNCKSLIFDSYDQIPQKEKVLVVDNKKEDFDPQVKHLFNEHIVGQIIILYIESTNMYAFGYVGDEELYLNGHPINRKKVYVLVKGCSIRSRKISPIYYSDVVGKFLESSVKTKITFVAEKLIFHFKNSTNGIQRFNFIEESGQLIGVMGGSGAGKSTLLNVFNGSLQPNSGSVTINGYDIYTEKDKLEGVIGFVPQDDLLIEELTVYQNLYYNAKLCFANYNDEQIDDAVTKVLQDLDLYEIRGLKVGGPLNKFISGGQRKRLNIALELIREPSVMFVDEPTSGLSSNDSEMVMDLLKEQALKGKLLIINIHQPSSDIYKLFDKLLIMDKGGHAVYYGNPIDAIVYFKKMTNHVNAEESECLSCGNVNPEQVLQILEAKVVDEYGKLTRTRKVSTKEWYDLYLENLNREVETSKVKGDIPESHFKIPGKLNQFKIFTIRDVLSKLTNRQYLLLNFLEAPVLATILGYFTKFISGDEYIFSENENLPAYMFMAVVVSLFLGLSVSAEEIIKDRKILKREKFLSLSRASYINSKVMIMFFISAIQSITFVLLGNNILGIEGLTFIYWFILFTAACFANVLGLNISALLNSVVTIYILIPFILVPQMLLSGVIVKFDKLHKNVSSFVYVPFVGDMMTSRWAYEALTVTTFRDNAFEKRFYDVEQEISEYGYISSMWLPEISTKLQYVDKHLKEEDKREDIDRTLRTVQNELYRISKNPYINQFDDIDKFTYDQFNEKLHRKANKWIDKYKKSFTKLTNKSRSKKDSLTSAYMIELGVEALDDEIGENNDTIVQKLVKKYGEDKLFAQIENFNPSKTPNDIQASVRRLGKIGYNNELSDHYNYQLRDLVRNRTELKKILEVDERFIQLTDPIYKRPESNFGRSQFYAPYKVFLGYRIDTVWYNILFIWFTTLVLYLILVFDLANKLASLLGNLRFFKKKY